MNFRKALRLARIFRSAASRNQGEDGKRRREVRGIVVRIRLKTLLPIPLTIIPLTLDFLGKTVK